MATCTFFAAPVIAESPETAPEEPTIAGRIDNLPDWSGFYVGAQVGTAAIDATPGDSGDDIIGGIVGGYDWDLGRWVAGVGADFDFTQVRVGQTDIENISRLKLRGGYKIGNGLLYGTTGYAHADTDIAGDDGGYFVGAGYEHRLSARFGIGAEVLYHEFNNFGVTVSDLDATTVQLRGVFRF